MLFTAWITLEQLEHLLSRDTGARAPWGAQDMPAVSAEQHFKRHKLLLHRGLSEPWSHTLALSHPSAEPTRATGGCRGTQQLPAHERR